MEELNKQKKIDFNKPNKTAGYEDLEHSKADECVDPNYKRSLIKSSSTKR
jgi:hypothetical protein